MCIYLENSVNCDINPHTKRKWKSENEIYTKRCIFKAKSKILKTVTLKVYENKFIRMLKYASRVNCYSGNELHCVWFTDER